MDINEAGGFHQPPAFFIIINVSLRIKFNISPTPKLLNNA